MEFWVNWRTRITHLSRDCHQIVVIPDVAWLEHQEGDLEELVGQGRRYCSWCVARLMLGVSAAGGDVELSAELHPPAERADYLPRYRKGEVAPRQ